MLTITWDNPNIISHDHTEVFRSESKDGEYVLVGTLAPDVLAYVDNAPLTLNSVYWYQVVFVDEFMEPADSVVFPMGYYPTGTGPGPQELLRGTWELGFFGNVNVGSLPNFDAIKAGYNTLWPVDTPPTTWSKCIAQGNILFIPNSVLFGPQSYIALHGKYVPAINGVTDVVNEVEKDGYFFSARPPYLSANRRNTASTEDLLTNAEATKWSEFAAVCSVFVDTVPESLGGVYKVNGGEGPVALSTIVTSTPATQSPYARWTVNKFPPTQIGQADTGNASLFVILELLFE